MTVLQRWAFAALTAGFSMAQKCYFPNGTHSADFVPCDTNAEHSACCAPTDECLTNGLCRPVTADKSSNEFWRDLCTDSTWESDACPKYCYNSTTNPGAPTVAYFVAGCSIDTYCCGDPGLWADQGNYYCCDDQSMLFNGGTPQWKSGPSLLIEAFTTTTSASGTASQSASSTPSSASSQTTNTARAASATGGSTETPQTSPDDNSTAIGVGVGVGVGVALLIVAAVGFFLWRRKQKRNQDKSQSTEASRGQPQKAKAWSPSQQAPPYSAYEQTGPHQGGHYNELSHEGAKVEMAGMQEDREAAELSADKFNR